MSDGPAARPSAAGFPTTQWSRVVAAGDPDAPGARAALAELCAGYWYPIYALIRRRGHGADEAGDLAQDYFARLLEKGVLGAADRRKGRFRAFLRTDCGFFLADARDRREARKRGGGAASFSIDAVVADGRYRAEPADEMTPERLFDRAWALALLEGALDEIRNEYAASGRAELFDHLKAFLTDDPHVVPYAALAARLDMTEAAIEGAVRRLRRRYRELLRARAAATIDEPSPADIDDEIRALFTALRR